MQATTGDARIGEALKAQSGWAATFSLVGVLGKRIVPGNAGATARNAPVSGAPFHSLASLPLIGGIKVPQGAFSPTGEPT